MDILSNRVRECVPCPVIDLNVLYSQNTYLLDSEWNYGIMCYTRKIAEPLKKNMNVPHRSKQYSCELMQSGWTKKMFFFLLFFCIVVFFLCVFGVLLFFCPLCV